MTEESEKDVYSASLIILGDDLNPEQITERLGIDPSQFWRRGESKLPDSESVAELGGWKCFIPDHLKDRELDEQIDWWCDILDGKQSVLQELEEIGYRLEMNCFVTNAFQIEPHSLERLSKLHLILTVFVY